MTLDDILAPFEGQPTAVKLTPHEELKRLRLQMAAVSDRILSLAEEHVPGIEAATSRLLKRIEELETQLANEAEMFT